MQIQYLIIALLMLIVGIQLPVIGFLYFRLRDLVSKYNKLLSNEKLKQDRINLLADEIGRIADAVQSANVEELGVVNSKIESLYTQIDTAVKGNESLANHFSSLKKELDSTQKSIKNQFQVLLGGGESGKNYM